MAMTGPGFSQSFSNHENTVFAKNADFTLADIPSYQNGLITNGQLWIGHTDADPDAQTIYVGNLVSPNGTIDIGYASPNITLDVAGGGYQWIDISGAFAPTEDYGYFITATATATLPNAPAQGYVVRFVVVSATDALTIQASGSDKIQLGTTVSAAAGTAVSTQQGDSILLVYRSSGKTWWCPGESTGSWNIT